MWTIHRPKRGWYIRLRAPSFPPGVFIPLLPVPRTAPHYADAALSFVCRTAVTTRTHEPTDSLSPPSSSRTSSESVSTDTTAVHGYPPSPPPPPPPPLVVQPPSPTEFDEKADQHVPQPRPRPRPRIHNQIGEFVMSPNRHPEPPAQSASFFARALSVFKSHAPSHSYSFTLSSLQPRPAQYNLRNLSPTQPQATLSSSAPQPQLSTAVPTAMPLLKFQDQTPALTISSITGLLEVDEVQEKALGVQNTFWIAVALTYLQFLEEREVSFILFSLVRVMMAYGTPELSGGVC